MKQIDSCFECPTVNHSWPILHGEDVRYHHIQASHHQYQKNHRIDSLASWVQLFFL